MFETDKTGELNIVSNPGISIKNRPVKNVLIDCRESLFHGVIEKMPIYEFKCNKCGNSFEQLIFSSDEEEKLACPLCGESDTCKLMSSFSSGSSSSCSTSSGGFS